MEATAEHMYGSGLIAPYIVAGSGMFNMQTLVVLASYNRSAAPSVRCSISQLNTMKSVSEVAVFVILQNTNSLVTVSWDF